jgi:glucose-1-phosphate thymidylyltransferase
MLPKPVDVWLDAGLPETVLSTNHYLLANGRGNHAALPAMDGVTIHLPVYIHPSAEVSGSTIGPNVSIGAGCKISGCTLKDAVIEDGAEVRDSELHQSLIGERAVVVSARGSLDIGDDSIVDLLGEAG